MRAVDTNVLLRLLARDDPDQVAVAEEFVRPGAWVSHLVLAEAAGALESVYGRTAGEIAEALDMLLEQESLAIQAPDVTRAAVARFRARPAVGFSEHLTLAIARKAGHLPLGTLDRGLSRLEGAQAL
jgi:predicted nucleic-acid-binding protein